MNEIKKHDAEHEKKLGEEKLRKRKKRIIKTFIVLCVAAVVMLIAISIIQRANEKKENEKKYSYDPRGEDYGMFYPEPDRSIFEDEDYAEKERVISYSTYEGYGTAYSLDDIKKQTPEIKLFIDYFNAAINGDGKTLNSLFIEEYYKNYGKQIEPYPDKFAMQKIYSISVTLIGAAQTENTLEGVLAREYFRVTFLLKENNGQFRPDIPEPGMPDGDRIPVVFEVLTINETSKINHVYDYTFTYPE